MFVIPALSRNLERFRLDSRFRGNDKKESWNDRMFGYFFNPQ
jgi:hypothetical protein